MLAIAVPSFSGNSVTLTLLLCSVPESGRETREGEEGNVAERKKRRR